MSNASFFANPPWNSPTWITSLATVSPPAEPSDPIDSGLSPDALMAYCESRLDSIGNQIQTSFTDQQKSAQEVTSINGVLSQIQALAPTGTQVPATCAQLETNLGALITNLKQSDPGCAALPALTQTYNDMVWSGTGGSTTGPPAQVFPGPQFIDATKYPPNTQYPKQGDNDLGTTELQGYAQSVTDAVNSLNSNAELQEIQLQSLVSQRQTAVSLTTNMVQSLGDELNKIADNIGH